MFTFQNPKWLTEVPYSSSGHGYFQEDNAAIFESEGRDVISCCDTYLGTRLVEKEQLVAPWYFRNVVVHAGSSAILGGADMHLISRCPCPGLLTPAHVQHQWYCPRNCRFPRWRMFVTGWYLVELVVYPRLRAISYKKDTNCDSAPGPPNLASRGLSKGQ